MKKGIITYDRLLRKRYRYVTEIRSLLKKGVIRTSIRIQGNRCGTKGCRCKREHNPILHGPYPYLSYRGKTKNHSILLTKNKNTHAIKANEIFTFLYEKDIEFHNNHAEQQIRPDVIFRKITFGNRSAKGAEVHDIAMSILQTAKLNNLDPLDTLQKILLSTKKNPLSKALAPP